MTICVITPDNSRLLTDDIHCAGDPMRAASPGPIEACTSAAAPPGIETQAHVNLMVGPMLTHCAQLEDGASAHVVARYSDGSRSWGPPCETP